MSDGGDDATQAPVEVQPTPTPIQFVEIVIAVQELPRGIRIPAENAVELRRWPLESVPFNALTDVDEVIGSIARIDIPRESPVLSTMVVESLQDVADVGSDAAAIMPSGLVAVSVPMDRFTGVAYAIRPGDYVDIILSMLFVDVDEDFQSILPNRISLVSIDEDGNIVVRDAVEGRLDVGLGGSSVIVGPFETQRPRLVTQLTVQNAWVLGTGEFPIEGDYIGATPTPIPSPTPEGEEGGDTARPAAPQPTAKPAPDIITLAVSPQDAVVLVWAIEARLPITLALRPATDLSLSQTQPVTLDYMMSNFNITAPNRLPYALEPALRSIRQLVIFQELQFGEGQLIQANN
ncbi:MAG: hypothetical protein JW910_17345 [Anaerolineae bacterium]|nr:hypothetical protein [Anaerolineae bacterium]